MGNIVNPLTTMFPFCLHVRKLFELILSFLLAFLRDHCSVKWVGVLFTLLDGGVQAKGSIHNLLMMTAS